MTTVPPTQPTVPIPQAPQSGNNKAYAATAAGFASTIIVYIVDQFLPHPLPPEIVAALQGLVTIAAVYFTPHGSA